MLPSFTTRPHFTISFSMYVENSAVVMVTAEAPSRSNAAFSSGDVSTAWTSR